MTHDEPQLNQPMHQPIYDRRATEAPRPCANHEQRLALTEQAVMSLKQTNEGITTKMDLLLAQMTKVALLEERNITQQVDLGRAHSKIEANSDKLEKLADESRAFMNYSKGQNKVLWAIGSVVLGLLIKALFFAAGHGMTP
jgi:hypothetical protein